jgi:pectin methylesterase-like acyl-CoA thioesterase
MMHAYRFTALALLSLIAVGAFSACQHAQHTKALVVAADGSGDFKTLQAAIDAVPANSAERTTIVVKRGTYAELPMVSAEKKNLTIRGEDRKETIIAATNNARLNPRRREMFTVLGDGFTLENLTLHNTTPKGGSQAETIRVRADRVILRHCDFKSFQDTLRLDGRVFVDECYVEGDVDFVWGGGTVYFRRCDIKALNDGYLVQSRNDAQHPGYVFVDCTITGAAGITRYVLARVEPSRFAYSHVAFINCRIGPFLSPVGWQLDKVPGAEKAGPGDHIRYEEFHNTDLAGRPLDLSQRLPVARQITQAEAAERRDPAKVLAGWNPLEPAP